MKVVGKIQCDLKKGIAMIRFEQDLGLYIAKLASRASKIDFAVPRLGCHATFLNRKFDDFSQKDFIAFSNSLQGRKWSVEFDFEKIKLNLSKNGFYGIYVTLDEKELDVLRKKAKVKTKKGGRFWGHITFCTTKGIGIKKPKDFWVSISD